MHKVLKIILFGFFCLVHACLFAQQKYAVIVAVDDYYDAPGVKSRSSLSGCVNDGKAIQALLENRFGFNPGNIYTLYNAAAIKKNLILRMRAVYQQCKPGDAVVFYFSGHGVWMTNKFLENDPVKRGMSQSIVLSDLYSPGWDCLMQDESLKNIFNQYIDKKIILTTIFDCCYSMNLPMMIGSPKYWDGWIDYLRPQTKFIHLEKITYVPVLKEPVGCAFDAGGILLDSLDSDGDGVPDCRDWEVYSLPGLSVDSTGAIIEQDFPPDFAFWKFNPDDQTGMSIDTTVIIDGDGTRGFSLKEALFVSNASSVRPSQRKNSGFLSLAATADNLKGLEISDIAGTRHGAFTAALLYVYKTSPSNLPVSELMTKINALMKKQFYNQGPGYHYEATRLKGNLVGTGVAGFSNKVRIKCTGIKNGMVILDKGLHDGITKGNILTGLTPGTRTTLQVLQSFPDSAVAKDNSNGRIKAGQFFEITDHYTISAPLLKVYIASAPFTPPGFDVFFKKKIMPLVNRKNYLDYHFGDTSGVNNIIFWEDANRFRSYEPKDPPDPHAVDQFCVFLPTPSYIADAIKAKFKEDQNLEIVPDASKADLVLYLNYAKKRPGTKTGFVFYFHPRIQYVGGDAMAEQLFAKSHVLVPGMNLSSQQLQSLSQSLHTQVKNLVRKKTNNWINEYKRRF